MKRTLICILSLIMAYGTVFAQTSVSDRTDNASGMSSDGSMMKYRRSSLYSVLIKHSNFPYGDDINTAFLSIPTPNKFNNHDCGPKSFESSAKKMKTKGKKKTKINSIDIEQFIKDNDIPRQMIAKWFNRNEVTGTFDLNLMMERGFYDAQQIDIDKAKASSRGIQALGDAGEELVGKTFLLVNDITFVDKGERSKKAGMAFQILGAVAGAFIGSDAQKIGNSLGNAVNDIDGFTVNITSYLYRLDWSPEIAETFWSEYWIDSDSQDISRRNAFNNSNLFALSYIGESTTSAGNTSSKSMTRASKNDQMLKVCTRAIDKSIVELQRKYDEFKVNVPIGEINSEKRTVKVPIGLKEGINEKSKFDVLIKVQKEDGSYTYKKVGKLQPKKKCIWDNRFGAIDEIQDKKSEGNAKLDATTFRILEGANQIVPGCLVREVTIKRAK